MFLADTHWFLFLTIALLPLSIATEICRHKDRQVPQLRRRDGLPLVQERRTVHQLLPLLLSAVHVFGQEEGACGYTYMYIAILHSLTHSLLYVSIYASLVLIGLSNIVYTQIIEFMWAKPYPVCKVTNMYLSIYQFAYFACLVT